MLVRKATSNDIGDILDLYKSGLRELGEDWVEHLLVRKIVNSFHLAPCFVLVVNDNIVGMAGLTTLIFAPTGQATLTDYMFYILPEHRGLKNLSALVDQCKAFSREKKMPLKIQFAAPVPEDVRKRLFKIGGFKVCAVIGEYKNG